jgi:hypothetical protein
MLVIKKYGLVLIFIMFILVYFRWDEVSNEQLNSLEVIYKKDRWTSQVWKYIYGVENDQLVEQESSIHSEEEIEKAYNKAITSDNLEKIAKMKLEIETLKEIKKETALAHQLFNDEKFVGEYNPEEYMEGATDNNLGLMDSMIAWQLAHEAAVEIYKVDHQRYLDSANQINKIESAIADLEHKYREKAIGNLSTMDWAIRHSLTGLWVIFALFLLTAYFSSLIKKDRKIENKTSSGH